MAILARGADTGEVTDLGTLCTWCQLVARDLLPKESDWLAPMPAFTHEIDPMTFFDVDRGVNGGTYSNLLADPRPPNELDFKRAEDRALATIPPGWLREQVAEAMRRCRRRLFG